MAPPVQIIYQDLSHKLKAASFIHFLNNYLLSVHYVPDTVWGTRIKEQTLYKSILKKSL